MRIRWRWAAPAMWGFVVVSCSRSELDSDLFGNFPSVGGASGRGGSTTSSAASGSDTVGTGAAGAIGVGTTGAGGVGGGATGDGGASGSVGAGGAIGSGGAGGATGSGGVTGAGGTGVGGASGAGGALGSGAATATGGAAGSAGGSAGRGGAAGSGGAAPRCGDGKVDPGEACDLGPRNADRPALVIQQASASRAVLPVTRAATATAFYNYFSSSSHTGFEEASAARMMLHQDRMSGALSLVVVLGIDEGTSGQTQPSGHATMSFTGLPRKVAVALSDDPGELYLTSQTTAQGDWHFNRNSDGGILSGLAFPGTWSVTITPAFMSGISSWEFSDDKASVPLTLTTPVTIDAFDSPSKCRTDCTIPRCGDGILDGGEVCDDGNTASGDGCASDCKSLL